ncbi:MAG TPA: ankyrin repeat domain-containing protein [Candidatus Acidoferrales bacterium]|nr:ankyrin repeat domain-containing protein [Candidatus Acidoferrales bacterium]
MFPNPQDALPLPARPNLTHYKKLAKDLVKACKSADDVAISAWTKRWLESLVKAQPRNLKPAERDWILGHQEDVTVFARKKLKEPERARRECSLAEAQFVLARSHGFLNWPEFSAHLDALAHKTSLTAAYETAAEAIVAGDEATLKRLLKQNPRLIRAKSSREHRSTLLHYVSANGVESYRQITPKNIVAITKLLLDSGADIHAEADVYGGGCDTLGLVATSAHPRIAGVQIELMQLLIDRGAEINKPGSTGNNYSPVMGCLANGCPEAAQYFAERGARLGLVEAAGLGKLAVVKTFFDENGNPQKDASPERTNEAFRYACGYGSAEVAKFLLDRGIDIAGSSGDDQTGLHYAALGGHLDVVKLLLDRKAPLDLREKVWSGTPLSWAIYGWSGAPKRGKYHEVIAALVKAGATVNPKWLSTANTDDPYVRNVQADPRMLAALRGELAVS